MCWHFHVARDQNDKFKWNFIETKAMKTQSFRSLVCFDPNFLNVFVICIIGTDVYSKRFQFQLQIPESLQDWMEQHTQLNKDSTQDTYRHTYTHAVRQTLYSSAKSNKQPKIVKRERKRKSARECLCYFPAHIHTVSRLTFQFAFVMRHLMYSKSEGKETQYVTLKFSINEFSDDSNGTYKWTYFKTRFRMIFHEKSYLIFNHN